MNQCYHSSKFACPLCLLEWGGEFAETSESVCVDLACIYLDDLEGKECEDF